MPEPSAGSKLLAEEFGIEYDEGAEGIDEQVHHENGIQIVVGDVPSFADELGGQTLGSAFHDAAPQSDDIPPEYDPAFGSPSVPNRSRKQKQPEQDAMEVLAQNLESTDKFLDHLRRLDVDPGSSTSQQPALERMASDVIRRINETTRDREGQVRELLEYEREFRRIAGEVGGNDVLGQLDELPQVNDLSESDIPTSPTVPSRLDTRHLVVAEEEPASAVPSSAIHDWEVDPDRHHLRDDDDDFESVASPIKDSFPPPPPMRGPPTPAMTIPQLAHLRTFTTSLVTSLTTISEQAQVNGAATTEAGRKIRALKNKMGGWRTDWDSAERSRVKIDRWEAGIIDGESADPSPGPATPTRLASAKRVDGRKLVAEHLREFELALADAAVKTRAIMAS